MKRGFWEKYWLCPILSILIYVINIIGLSSYAILLVAPLCAIIYGVLSYIISKKIIMPQLILFVINFACWFGFDRNSLDWAGTYIWSVGPAVFSLVGTLFTALAYHVKKELTDSKEYVSQTEDDKN